MSDGNAKTRLDALLADFGVRTGSTGLATDENGIATLSVDGRLQVSMLVDPGLDKLIVWIVLGQLPRDNTEAALRGLLEANLFWQHTEGATIGLMPEGGEVVLAIREPMASLDGGVLVALVNALVDRAGTLSAFLTATPRPRPASDQAVRPQRSQLRV
jgi:hypothetical protein